MIRNDWGVVLWRRAAGEFDRRVVLLTQGHGTLAARFGGVNRAAGKLKALSEPLVWGEYRLHFSPRTGAVRVVGGRIVSSFPGVRADLSRTLRALALCEMALRMAPRESASPEKYRLLCRALEALDAGPAPWVEAAFGLRLLESAGCSLRELPVPPAERGLWRALHETPLEDLSSLAWQAASGGRFLRVVRDHVEAHAERPLLGGDAAQRWARYAAGLSCARKEKVPC